MLKKAITAAGREELVTFLRCIELGLRDGETIPDAYSKALSETKVLKHLIGEIPKGVPFDEGLIEAAKQSKIRMMLVFAQQVHLNYRASGDLKQALIKSAKTAEIMSHMQQQAADDYDAKRQRKLLLLGGAAAATVVVAKLLHRRSK